MMPANRRVSRASSPDVTEPATTLAPAPAPPSLFHRALMVARLSLGIALIVGVSGTLAWSIRRYVRATRRFALEEVEIQGARHKTAEQIENEAGLTRGTNVFTIDLDEARAKLLADPWIGDASLSRRLPGTIAIQLAEREAGAVVALGGEAYLSTRDGETFKRFDPGDPSDLPVVTGLTPEMLADDREGARRTIRRAIDLAADYDHTDLGSRAPLQEVHVASDGSYSLVVGKSTTSLLLGEPPFRRKIDQAARVVAELDRRGAKAQAIMLDNDARPERVVVRLR
jgi:cell division protein FtsQ